MPYYEQEYLNLAQCEASITAHEQAIESYEDTLTKLNAREHQPPRSSDCSRTRRRRCNGRGIGASP